MHNSTQYKIEPPKSFRPNFHELWNYRELLYYFSWRDIKVKYKETVLGITWVLLQPIVMTLLFSLIFSRGLKLATGVIPYPLFVLTGLVLWNFISSSITNSAHSMELNSRIVKKIYFPRLIIPISSIITSAFDLLLGLGLVIAAIIYFGVPIYFQKLIIAIPFSLTILALTAIGFACMFSILTVIYKDFRYIIPFLIQFLFFTSPVFYDLKSLGDGWWSELFLWNPFSGGIDIFRQIFSAQSFPFTSAIKPLTTAILIFISGLIVFNKMEPELADHI